MTTRFEMRRIYAMLLAAISVGIAAAPARALTSAQSQAETACNKILKERNQIGSSPGYLYMPKGDQKLADTKITAIDKALGRCLAQPRPAAWQMQKARDDAASALAFVKGLVQQNAKASQQAQQKAAQQKQADNRARDLV